MRGHESVPRGMGNASGRILVALIHGTSWIVDRLPLEHALVLGAGIGRFWYVLRGPRTRRVREQIAGSLPEFDSRQHARWTREVFMHLGQSVAEMLLLRSRHRAALVERVSVEGLEHLEAAESRSSGGGMLVVTAHYGNWELACARMAKLELRTSVVYRPLEYPDLDALVRQTRASGSNPEGSGPSVEQIPMGRAGTQAARALARGRKLVVLMDQNARRDEGLFVEFFGRPASTRFGPLAIAATRDCPVIPAFIRRDPNGRTHTLRIHPALQLEAGAADDEEVLRRNLQRVTAAIEKEIRESPGQWIWTHRRWRTRPAASDPS